MVVDGAVSCIRRLEKIDGGGSTDEVHVLAVDDSLIDRKVIERLLRVTSCKVTAVDSGWRALQLLGLDEVKTDSSFDRLKVDLIITDYCMPGMTGYELLKKVKESSNFREIPVVIMSSENVLARIDRCLEEGAEDFLIKPVKLSDVKRLREYMTRDVKSANGTKRKLREDSCDVSSSAPSPPSSASPSPSDSSASPSPSDSSTSPSPSDSSDPSSPQPSDSPNRRQKTTSPGLDWNQPCDLSPFNIN